MADRGHHGKGEHHERDVTMPAMPRAGLVLVELFSRCIVAPSPGVLAAFEAQFTTRASRQH